MPVLKPKPSAPPATDQLQVQVAEPRYQTQTPLVDSRYTPAADILVYVEGSAWATNYYSQVVGAESELGPLNDQTAPAYQQYCKIEQMELKVTSPLQPVEDPETHAFNVTGAATTCPRFIPNKNDMFLAAIGDGRVGLFTITMTEKKSYHKDALYHIEYQLVDYADSEVGKDKVADLEEKTVKTAVYVEDFLAFGQNPVVLSQDFDYLIKFEDAYGTLLTHYFSDFFSREQQTLLIPDQNGEASYDPFLTRCLLDFVSTGDHPFVARIKLPRVAGDPAMNTHSVWDAVVRMDKQLLPIALHKAKLVDTAYFRNQPHMAGIFFTGVQNVMYPYDNRTDADASDADAPPTDGAALVPGGPRYKDLLRSSQVVTDHPSYNGSEDALPDIVPVTIDAYYVFSDAFYGVSTPLKSNLEKLVKDALEEKPLDKATLLRLVNDAHKWGNLERFYYIPALLAILKVATRTH